MRRGVLGGRGSWSIRRLEVRPRDISRGHFASEVTVGRSASSLAAPTSSTLFIYCRGCFLDRRGNRSGSSAPNSRSWNALASMWLPRSLRSLAMTLRGNDLRRHVVAALRLRSGQAVAALPRSNNPPAQPGALNSEPLKAVLICGPAKAGHLKSCN